jgi:hypothetical protein
VKILLAIPIVNCTVRLTIELEAGQTLKQNCIAEGSKYSRILKTIQSTWIIPFIFTKKYLI